MFRFTTSRLALFIFVMAFSLLSVGCSEDDPVTTPVVEDDPYALSLSRHDWLWASSPFLGQNALDRRLFVPENRVESVRWFRPRDRVLRRYLNPDLIKQERDETQPAIQLYLRADDGAWDPEDWGGITQGLGREGWDLTEAQYFEIWVNDGLPDKSLRRGQLHIDFGVISEDGFWPVDHDGNLIIMKREYEDTNDDGVFSTPDEDVGLDGNEFGPQRYDASYEIDGDSPYPHINGTARNNREDSEDIDGSYHIGFSNGYFTMTIDLKETGAAVDVVYDFDDVDDLVAENIAWRKYRIPLVMMDSFTSDVSPRLDYVHHFRLWFEDDEQVGSSARSLQFSGLKFVIPD